jgi:hypothetical protein
VYSRKQFAALEAMSREQAALAKTEMEHSLMEYWLAEAEEWKQLRQSIPSKDEFRIAQVISRNRTTPNSNDNTR